MPGGNAFGNTTFMHSDFEQTLALAIKDDLVYL